MGFSPGRFTDMRGIDRHIEQKDDRVRVYFQSDECGPAFDLAPDQARRMAKHLLLAAHLIDGEEA
jgi:hypothetical protein